MGTRAKQKSVHEIAKDRGFIESVWMWAGEWVITRWSIEAEKGAMDASQGCPSATVVYKKND